MTPVRIHAIKTIKNYRIFQSWKPSGGTEFGRVNVIYGQNGSGKSTFASLLQGCAECTLPEVAGNDERYSEVRGSGLVIDACEDRNSPRTATISIGLSNDAFWRRVKVFNREFIRRTLHFDAPTGPQPDAILTIGERVADAEDKLEELRSRLRTSVQGEPQVESEAEDAEKAVGKHLSGIATQIVDDLSGAPGFSPRGYTRKNVLKILNEFEKDPAVLDDVSDDPLQDRDVAKSSALQPVTLSTRSEVLEQQGVDEARQLLAANVLSSRRLDELTGSPDRSRWVQEGIDLHEGLDDCLFCGHALTADRLEALNAHFDESFKTLQISVDDLIKRLSESVRESQEYLDAFPSESEVYVDLQSRLRDARDSYAAAHKKYAKAGASITKVLKEKKDNPFAVPAIAPDLQLVAPSSAALEGVIADQLHKIDGHDREAREAAGRLERFYVKRSVEEHVRLKRQAEEKQATLQERRRDIEALQEEIATLENVEGDPLPGAAELTEGLQSLLGRDELSFSAPDTKHYAINRAGAPATNLSEGEQTAIALLYFLASIREDKIQGEPPIVVIDDPVSSMDKSILFGASAHLWADLVGKTYASQVFLLTHNFDLFRRWLIQLESRQQHEDCDYKAFEMTSRLVPRGPDKYVRSPLLRRWETDQGRSKVLRSEYNYLFWRVAHAVIDRNGEESLADQMNELALMPNAARRMLEAFLSFKTPGKIGSFHVAVEEVMNATDLDRTSRTRVERYLHTYSHFDSGDISQPLQLSEVTGVLRSLFQLMHEVDGEHVSAMCGALGIEESLLLGAEAATTPHCSLG